MWYTPVFASGAWRVKDHTGRISAVSFPSEGRAGKAASKLNDARAMHFRVMDDEAFTVRRYDG